MRILLDTHVLLWWLAGSRRLPNEIRDLIAGEAHDVFVSAVSVWEVAIKRTLGRIRIDVDEMLRGIEDDQFHRLPVDLAHAAAVASLPLVHSDPFDRLLLAQSRIENLALVSHDAVFLEYGSGPGPAPIVF